MPLRPEEVSELSRLLDEVLELDATQRKPWLQELEGSRPEVALRLRGMLRQAESSDTALLPKLSSVDPEDAVALPGERVGPYLLVREIGRGGMGSVWLAERADGTYKRRVALKLPRLTWSAGLGKRMARERDIGALLEHPNIARLYDAGVDEHGRPFIAMEYIDGQPIDVYCREHSLDIRARLKLFVQVAEAVAYAHGRLVLHRDLKPSNVLIDAGGQAHLLDFGIAKLLDDPAGAELTQEQGRVLTLSYAAPEHIAGRPIGVAADVYSLGVLLYELLTGTMPFTAKRRTAGAQEEAILAGDAPPPSGRVSDARLARQLRGDLDAIIGKAIKRDPSERYQTAGTLAADIRRYLDGHAIDARPDSAWYRLRKAVVRHRVPVGAAAAVFLALLLGAVATLYQRGRAADETERAQLATAFVADLFRVDASQPTFMDGTASRPTQAVLLERGVKLIDARFATQPALKAELYGAIGRVYVELGQHQLGSEFGNRQLKILREQRATDREAARALLLLSEAAVAARRDVDAENLAQQAVDLLGNDVALKPDALALLAGAQSRNGKKAQAEQTLAEGRSALQQRGPEPSQAKAQLLWVEAGLLSIQNRFDEALPRFLEAIDVALAAEGPSSSAAFEWRMRLAEGLITLNRPEEGRRFRDEAIRSFEGLGGIQQIRAARAKARLKEREYMMGYTTYADATSALEQASSFLALQSSMIPAELLAEVGFDLAKIHSYYGDLAAAEPLMLSSVSVLRRNSQALRDRFAFATFVGVLEMSLGDHAAADVTLREALELRRQMGQAELPFAVTEWLYVAQNLSMQDRHEEALTFLSGAPAFVNVKGDDAADYKAVIPMAVAQIHLDARNVEGARAALRSIKGNYSLEKHWRYYDYFAILGELRCAEGDTANGLSQLRAAEGALSPQVSPIAPELARLRSLIGLCALSNGDRKQAETMAARARAAFQEQPRVSSYYKKPLQQLDARLGLKSIKRLG